MRTRHFCPPGDLRLRTRRPAPAGGTSSAEPNTFRSGDLLHALPHNGRQPEASDARPGVPPHPPHPHFALLVLLPFPKPMNSVTKAAFFLVPAALVVTGAELYQKPSKAILDALNSPPTPTLTVNPARTFAMQGQAVRYPPIAELSQPMLRLAGLRINPKTNGLHNTTFNSSLTLRKIPEGTEIKVDLPPNPKLSLGRWSPDATKFAFTNTTDRGVELWVGDISGKAHRIEGVRVNPILGGGFAAGRTRRSRRRPQRCAVDARRQEPAHHHGQAQPRTRSRRARRPHRTARAGEPGRRCARGHPRGHAAEPA